MKLMFCSKTLHDKSCYFFFIVWPDFKCTWPLFSNNTLFCSFCSIYFLPHIFITPNKRIIFILMQYFSVRKDRQSSICRAKTKTLKSHLYDFKFVFGSITLISCVDLPHIHVDWDVLGWIVLFITISSFVKDYLSRRKLDFSKNWNWIFIIKIVQNHSRQ